MNNSSKDQMDNAKNPLSTIEQQKTLESKSRLAFLDILRFFAAFIVIIAHLYDSNVAHQGFKIFDLIRTKNRQKLQDFLLKEKIQTVIHYPIPPHKQKAYKEFNHLSFPITEKIHEEILSLPLYPHLEKNHIDKIVEAVNIFEE